PQIDDDDAVLDGPRQWKGGSRLPPARRFMGSFMPEIAPTPTLPRKRGRESDAKRRAGGGEAAEKRCEEREWNASRSPGYRSRHWSPAPGRRCCFFLAATMSRRTGRLSTAWRRISGWSCRA